MPFLTRRRLLVGSAVAAAATPLAALVPDADAATAGPVDRAYAYLDTVNYADAAP
jgi:hypothetical protein